MQHHVGVGAHYEGTLVFGVVHLGPQVLYPSAIPSTMGLANS